MCSSCCHTVGCHWPSICLPSVTPPVSSKPDRLVEPKEGLLRSSEAGRVAVVSPLDTSKPSPSKSSSWLCWGSHSEPCTACGQPAKPQVGRWRRLWMQFGGCSRGCRCQQDAGKPRQPAGKGAVAERRGRQLGMVQQAVRGEKQEQISCTLLAEQPASSSAIDVATGGTASR